MAVVKFEDVATRVNTKEDRHNTDLVYYVGGDHIDSESLKVSKRGIIKGAPLGPMFYFGFKPGDILFVTRNPHLRKCAVVDFAGICSEKTLVIATKDETVLCQKYLAGVMQSDDFWDFLEENKSGSVNYFINWSTLAEYEFDLPPIEEQRALAEKLWAANDLKEKYQHLLAATDEMLKAKFREMFGDCDDGAGYPIRRIGDFAELVTKGTTPTSVGFQFEQSGVRFVKAENITDEGEFLVSQMMHISFECHDKLRRSQLQVGDFLFTIAGVIGRVAVVPESVLPANTNQAICILRSRDMPELNKDFFKIILRSEYVRSQCEGKQKQTAQANISLTDVNNLLIPFPPINLQREFVAIANAAEASKAELKKSIASIDAVMKGLING